MSSGGRGNGELGHFSECRTGLVSREDSPFRRVSLTSINTINRGKDDGDKCVYVLFD